MDRKQNVKVLIALAVIFLFFHWIATVLGSDRGQMGVAVGVMVVVLTLLAAMLIFTAGLRESAISIGLGRPAVKGIGAGLVIGGGMLMSAPIFSLIFGAGFTLYPGWGILAVGLFFQAGIAEETLFRGFLFGHYRRNYSFWKAAAISAVPFVIVHFILLFTMPWPIAVASILLAVVMSFPFARVYELGGNTVWPPAIVHFMAQAGVKLLVVNGDSASLYPLYWIAACATIPWIVFLIPKRPMSQ